LEVAVLGSLAVFDQMIISGAEAFLLLPLLGNLIGGHDV